MKKIRGKRHHNPEQKNNNTEEFGAEFGDVNASKYYEAKASTDAEVRKAQGAKENGENGK